jgi:glycerol kinase
MAYQVADLVKCMENDTDTPITLIRCDGGAVRDKFLMQFQSDVLDIPIEIPDCTEATARGAAFAAAVGVGMAKIEDAESLFEVKTRYTPAMTADERTHLQNAWHRAVERAKKLSEEK